jgi:ribosomal protein S21
MGVINVQVNASRNGLEGERLIRKFIKKVKKSGILDEVKDRRYYTKKSVKKRLKRLNKKRVSRESTRKNQE